MVSKRRLVRVATRYVHGSRHTAHVAPVADILNVPDDQFEELLDDVADMLSVFVLEDFFTARFGEDAGLNVVDDCLKRRGWRETAPGRSYLESLRDSTVSLYEVVGIDPGRSMALRDLIRGGETVTVHEKLGSKSAAPWDRLAARIVEVNSKMYFTGAVLRFRHELSLQFLSMFDEMAKEMEDDIPLEALREIGKPADVRSTVRELILGGGPGAQMFTHIWLLDTILQAQAPLPELHNTDDEPIVFCRVRFPIVGDEVEVATMLDGIECFERDEEDKPSWTWSVSGSPLHRMALRRRGDEASESETVIGNTSPRPRRDGNGDADAVRQLARTSRERTEPPGILSGRSCRASADRAPGSGEGAVRTGGAVGRRTRDSAR